MAVVPRPSPAREIDRLLSYASGPVPPLYRQYLEVFGAGDGIIRLCDDAQCDVPTLLRWHEKRSADERPYKPENATLLSIQSLSLGRCLIHDGGAEPRVAINDFDEVVRVLASSFKIYLYQHTWLLRWFAGVSTARSSVATRDELLQAALTLNVDKLWFSDEYAFCAENNDIRIRIYTSDDQACMDLRAATKELGERIFLEHLKRRFPDLKR